MQMGIAGSVCHGDCNCHSRSDARYSGRDKARLESDCRACFLWNPQWDKLKDAMSGWQRAGQISFTLSAGFGVILTYASYLTKQDDVHLSA